MSEITRSHYHPDGTLDAPKDGERHGESIADNFESVIDLQETDGYDLESWQLTSASTDQVLTETIIAVFKERPK